jgi:hypothetical protein
MSSAISDKTDAYLQKGLTLDQAIAAAVEEVIGRAHDEEGKPVSVR